MEQKDTIDISSITSILKLLHRTKKADNCYYFSTPKAFEMSEEEYERRIISPDNMSSGIGLFRLYQHFEGNSRGVTLELGAGGGALTIGFLRETCAMEINHIITDPSPTFLKIIKNKLHSYAIPENRITYGTLLGEDLCLFPSDSIDLIFMQACLHHITDYQQFLLDAKRVLAPGGMLVFQEPFSDGYIAMAIVVSLLIGMKQNDFTILPQDHQKLLGMLDSMCFQSDRTIDKSNAEDKHCFLTDDLLGRCSNIFESVYFFRNQSFDSISRIPDINNIHSAQSCSCSITGYLRSFMTQHHLLSDSCAHKYDLYVAPALAAVDKLFVQGDGPALFATVLCRK